MEVAKHAVFLTLLGMRDCFWGVISLKHFLFSKQTDSKNQSLQRFSVKRDNPQVSVSNILLQCIAFGSLFWISNIVFNKFLLNDFLLRLFVYMEEDSDYVIWLQNGLYSLFCLTWILPMVATGKILNFLWYQDIADLTFKKSGIKKKANMSISDFYTEQLKSFILQLLYCVQGTVVYLLPLPAIVQHVWYLFHISIFTSLYAFEYKWVYVGWTLQRRLITIDRKWPYFLGFGLPLAFVTSFIPFVDSMIVYATLFPIYVISSTVTYDSQSPAFLHPFHSFKFVDSVSDTILSFIFKLLFGNPS